MLMLKKNHLSIIETPLMGHRLCLSGYLQYFYYRIHSLPFWCWYDDWLTFHHSSCFLLLFYSYTCICLFFISCYLKIIISLKGLTICFEFILRARLQGQQCFVECGFLLINSSQSFCSQIVVSRDANSWHLEFMVEILIEWVILFGVKAFEVQWWKCQRGFFFIPNLKNWI